MDNFIESFKATCKRSEALMGKQAVPEEPVRARGARLVAKLEGTFDQSNGATVRVIPAGNDFIVSVRPKGRRREYTLRLSDLARLIITRVALAEAQ